MPFNEVLEFRTGGVAWNSNPIVTNRTSVLVVFLDPAASNLETFPVIPMAN